MKQNSLPLISRHFQLLIVSTLLQVFSFIGVQAQSAKDSNLYIASLKIIGNKHTWTKYIYREIEYKIGDSVPKKIIDKPLRFLQTLNNTLVFTHTELKIDSIDAEKRVYLSLEVFERWYTLPTGNLKVADRNINVWLQNPSIYRIYVAFGLGNDNLIGIGDKIVFKVKFGWRNGIDFKYYIPFLDNFGQFGTQVIVSTENGQEIGYITSNNKLQFERTERVTIYKSLVADARIIWRPKYRLRGSLGYGYRQFSIADTVAKFLNPEYLYNNEKDLSFQVVTAGLSIDKRDRSFYPFTGYIAQLDGEIAIGTPNKGFSYSKCTLNLRYYLKVNQLKNVFIAGGFRGEKIFNTTVPYLLRSPLGYRYKMRGFERYLLEGNANYYSTLDLKYMFIDKIIYLKRIPFEQFRYYPLKALFTVYFDQGQVFYPNVINGNDLVNRSLFTYGLGLHILSAYERIVRIELSTNNLGETGVFLHFTDLF